MYVTVITEQKTHPLYVPISTPSLLAVPLPSLTMYAGSSLKTSLNSPSSLKSFISAEVAVPPWIEALKIRTLESDC